MKKLGVILVPAAALLAAGCQTTAQPTRAELRESMLTAAAQEEDGEETAVSDPDWDPNEMICKTVRTTGTRIGKTKDCRTAQQWRDSMSNATRAMNDFKDTKGGMGTIRQ